MTQPVGFRGDALTELLRTVRADETSLPVISTSPFQDSGRITIEGERIRYASKTPTSFEGCTRGADLQEGGTGQMPHPGGALVSQDTPTLKGLVHNEILVPQRSALALIEGSGIDLTLVDNPALERSEVTITNLRNALDDLTDVAVTTATEGDALIHDGANFINRPSGELAKGRISGFVDDFDCGTGLSGAIGRENWSLNLSGSGSGAAIASETQHPGLYRLSTGATLNSVAGLYNTAGPYLNDVDECEFIFRIGSSLASVQYGVFLADTVALTGNVVGVIFNSAVDATNWTTYKTVAAANTTASFSKAAVASEWWRAFFKRTGSGAFDLTIERMSDNTSATVSVSGLTLAAYTNVQFRCVGLTTANKTMDPDYFRLNSEVLTRN
jgi:hypothetical protein